MTGVQPVLGGGRPDLSQDERFEAIARSHLPWQLDLDAGFTPRTREATLGESRVVGCHIGGMVGRRRRGELRRTPGEFVAVLMVNRGTEYISQHGRTAEVGAGAAALWDGVRPVECYTPGRLVKQTYFVPRQILEGLVPQLDSILARTLPASPSVRLLSSWLQTSMREPLLDGELSQTAGRVAIDLLRSAVAHAEGASRTDPHTVRLLQVKAFVDQHLGDPELTLSSIARANAVSLRYLHLLFHDTGETARQYLLRRRLERARELLLSPGAALPVGEVATRSGFDSPSAFSRAYRARYGSAPRDARREHLLA